ncbi:ATP synthase subunit C [Caproiciproducens sp. R2]|uniref:ATP synthase subunit C n=1 Tax=Caproiciproducens sp. R2 TaxID=3435187 RepID=UPI004034A2F2
MNFVLICLPVLFLIASVILSVRSVKNGKKVRSAIATQLLAFMAVCVLTFAIPVVASATTPSDTPAAPTTSDTATPAASNGLGLIAAALVTGLAGIGGGIAVAAAAPAAIGATSEDPKAFGKALIFVALGEGIALYGLLISILILNKV